MVGTELDQKINVILEVCQMLHHHFHSATLNHEKKRWNTSDIINDYKIQRRFFGALCSVIFNEMQWDWHYEDDSFSVGFIHEIWDTW